MTEGKPRGFFRSAVHRVTGFFKWYFMMIGLFVTLAGLVVSIAAGRAGAGEKLPESMILTHTFKRGVDEVADGAAFGPSLLRPSKTFHELAGSLRAAAKDARVKALVVKLEDQALNPAQVQELRDVLAGFRTAGKFTAFYAEDIGGMSGGMGDYYLASAFAQVWVQPVGAVSINGVAAEVPFFKGTLDKIGVQPDFAHKGIYKSAPESLTETGMTAPHREMMTALVDDLSGQIVEGIAAARGFSVDEVRALVNGAPYTGEEALKLKLVDKIGYYDEMKEAVKEAAADPKAEDVSLKDYTPPDHPLLRDKKAPGLALIIGSGDIVSGSAPRSGFAAEKIAKAFKLAEEDKSIVAAVLRIDSPGGSPTAAETIRRAILRMQKAGKPVIVSMGGAAASGGYWVASAADKIVAEPATITGSIGVFGGKFVLAPLWDKIGVRWESVTAGENARMWSSNAPFTEKQKARFEALLGGIYDSFIARVAEGRKMTREEVEAVAEGRVWTGRQAKEKKLVDELGGIDKAVALAKEAGGLPVDQDAPLRLFPPAKSPVEKLLALLSGENDDMFADAHISLADLHALLKEAQPEGAALRMPEFKLR